MIRWLQKIGIGSKKTTPQPFRWDTPREIEAGLAKADIKGVKKVLAHQWTGNMVPTDEEMTYWRAELERLEKKLAALIAKSDFQNDPNPYEDNVSGFRLRWQWMIAGGHECILRHCYGRDKSTRVRLDDSAPTETEA